jgi:hypothetical protein
MAREVPLPGGNASGPVVRVGDTVRKPWTATTGRVAAYLETLANAGIDVPVLRGRDGHGRQVLEHVPGELALDLPPLDAAGLARIGRMIRAIHDASPGYDPADGDWPVLLPAAHPDLICHNDLAPWNLIVGDRWVVIDWDGAGPSTRLWDLAYAAQAFTLNDVAVDPVDAGRRLRVLVDAYAADDALRGALPAAMAQRAAAMRDLLRASRADGREPWGTMARDGHEAHWTAATAYVADHRAVWAAALARS